MLFETVITSVPRGLKAGRTGFQPVMRTRGLRDDVLRQLEPLTGYRHVHRQGSGQNPANYSYRRLVSNVGDLAVLGRTVDAGSDFSNRSNKCGHLIAFTTDELGHFSSTTPAALLADNAGALASQWTKGPEERAASPALAVQPQAPGICTLWQNQFGDAGWAAVVAERARRRQPTMLVAPDSTPQSSELLLQLIREATALLPPAVRWAVSFETTVLGASDALIQGTYRGSPEAEATRAGVLVLPLGGPAPPGQLQENDLCKIARFGQPRPAPPAVTAAGPRAPTSDNFLGGDRPSPASGLPPPPQLPSTTPFEPVDYDAGEPKSHLGMIAGGLTIVLLALFLVGYAFVANLDLFWPEKPNGRPKDKDNAENNVPEPSPQSPQEVLNAYLDATHEKKPSADLPDEPSTDDWQKWLKSRGVEDDIGETWQSYANAVLRVCNPSESNPFHTEWKQKERAFLEAVKNLSNLKPKIADFYFLLLCPPPKISNGDGALQQQTASFIAAALDAYRRGRPDGKIKPDDVIENALNAAAFYCDLTTFLETATDEESSPKPETLELASRWPSIPGLPPVTSKQETDDLQKQRREFFLKSLLSSIQDGGKDSPHFTYKILVERANAFKNALERLVQYATPNTPNPKTPTLDDYVTVYGDPSPHTAKELNAALQSLQKAPEHLDDILKEAKIVAAWETLKNEFGKTRHDNGELKRIVLAKGIKYSDDIHKFIEPAFATKRATIIAAVDSWAVTVYGDLCCTIKWDSDKTELVAEFTDKPPARALQSIPLVVHRKKDGRVVDRTRPLRIRETPIQYAFHSGKAQQTVRSLAEKGAPQFIEIRPSETNDPTNIKDILSVLDKKDLTFTTTLSPEVEKNHIRVSAIETTTTDGTFNFTYKVPTDKKRQGSVPYGPDDEIIATINFSVDALNNRMQLSTLGPELKEPHFLLSTKRSLEKNTVGKSEFADIAHAAFLFSNVKEPGLEKPARLKPVLIEITNLHAFGYDEKEGQLEIKEFIFGDESGGENKKAETLFSNNNFSEPDKIGSLKDRSLLGKTDAASLDKRSWEITLASYLVKSSKVPDKTKSFEAAEKALKTTEKTLASLKENEKENKEEINKQEKSKQKQTADKNEITTWFKGGWAREDLRKIAEELRKQASNDNSREALRTRVAAAIYLNLRPFLGRYLLANNDQVKDIPLASLLRSEIAYVPPPEFGEKFTIAVIDPAPDSDRRDPRAPVD